MKQVILVLAAVSSLAAHGELKMQTKALPLYVSQTGTQLTPVEAVKASIRGEKILKCEPVEAQASETGNVSLKKVK
jgi:hypothetical protein